MKISTYFLLFFALFLCNFAKAQDTIPTIPTPSPELQKVMNRVPEIKKLINLAISSFNGDNDVIILTKYFHEVKSNIIDKKIISSDETRIVTSFIEKMSYQKVQEGMKMKEEGMKMKEEARKSLEEAEKQERELLNTKRKIKLPPPNEELSEEDKKAELSQIAKDIENKVAGAEQKYVAYVEENPELKADEKVRVLYEKCKAKLKK